jgi:hypothetical protein
MAGQALRAVLEHVPRYTLVCYRSGNKIHAVVSTAQGGYWARIHTSGSAVEGNRVCGDVGQLVALLAEAGIPVESGWEPWQAGERKVE